jgi:hypothetical protein
VRISRKDRPKKYPNKWKDIEANVLKTTEEYVREFDKLNGLMSGGTIVNGVKV